MSQLIGRKRRLIDDENNNEVISTQENRRKRRKKKISRTKLEKEIKALKKSKQKGWFSYYHIRDELYNLYDGLLNPQVVSQGNIQTEIPTHIKDLIKKNLEKTKCPICLLQIKKEDLNITSCGHFFHFACIKQWFEIKKECPQCRKKLKSY